MNSNQDQIKGSDFSEFASADTLLWSRIIGCTLHHTDFGIGKIKNIKQRKNYIPLIEIEFDKKGSGTYNSHSFKNEKFTIFIDKNSIKDEIKIFKENKLKETQKIKIEEIEIRRIKTEQLRLLAEEQIRQEKIDALRLKEFQRVSELARKHSASLESCWDGEKFTEIVAILEKIDSKKIPSNYEISLLEASKLFRLVARIHFIQYRKNQDIWSLAKACRFLRKSKFPEMAIEISTKESSSIYYKNKRALSALLASRGGAFRDMNSLDLAKESAETSIRFDPKSPHPYNLMGAICYQQGAPADGDNYFSEAVRLGSIPRQQDKEIRISFEKATPEAKKIVAKHLIAKDESRYAWAKEHVDAADMLNPDHEYELHQINLETQETRENFARSEEEGWFYGDD